MTTEALKRAWNAYVADSERMYRSMRTPGPWPQDVTYKEWSAIKPLMSLMQKTTNHLNALQSSTRSMRKILR